MALTLTWTPSGSFNITDAAGNTLKAVGPISGTNNTANYVVQAVGINGVEIVVNPALQTSTDPLDPVLEIDGITYPSLTYAQVHNAATTPLIIGATIDLNGVAEGDLDVGDLLSAEPVMLYGGTEPDIDITWNANGTPIVDGTEYSFILTAAEQGKTVTMVAAPDGGAAFESAGVNVPAGASSLLVDTGRAAYAGVNTTTPSAVLDLSALSAGDLLVILVGPTQISSALDVDAVAATKVGDGGGNAGARVSLYKYVMPGAGSATTTIDWILNNNAANEQVTFMAFRGGTDITSVAFDQDGSGGDLSAGTTPTQVSNYVGALCIGESASFASRVWTTVTEIEGADGLPGADGYSIAGLADAPLVLQTITKTGNGADSQGMAVFTYE